MYQVVRARLRALTARVRGARRDAGMVTKRVAALAVSHAGRVALRGGWASALSRVSVIHRVPFRGFGVT